MTHQPIGRLAMREEGSYWVAYYALEGTMRGSIKLGMVHMGFIKRDPARKAQFMDMMKHAVADIIEEKVGARPIWPSASAWRANGIRAITTTLRRASARSPLKRARFRSLGGSAERCQLSGGVIQT